MAYQSISSCRFWMNEIQFLASNGMPSWTNVHTDNPGVGMPDCVLDEFGEFVLPDPLTNVPGSLFATLPMRKYSLHTWNETAGNDSTDRMVTFGKFFFPHNLVNPFAITLGMENVGQYENTQQEITNEWIQWDELNTTDPVSILDGTCSLSSLITDQTTCEQNGGTWTPGLQINTVPIWPSNYVQNGFSLMELTGTPTSVMFFTTDEHIGTDGVSDFTMPMIGSIIIGSYYTLPHSAELKLTTSREIVNVKTMRSLGGHNLYEYRNPRYIERLNPWEQTLTNNVDVGLGRKSLRSWDLDFKMMRDTDLFPKYNALTIFGSNEPIDAASDAAQELNLQGSNDFYTQVLLRSNMGQLAFVFQPDSRYTTRDNFAVCKFDMKKFSYKQVAHNIYNIKLKIIEVI